MEHGVARCQPSISRTGLVLDDTSVLEGLQNILRRESDGIVGRPNYTYGSRAKDPSKWDSIHQELQTNVSMRMEIGEGGEFVLSGRGELHLAILQGVGERYDTPYFDNLKRYARRPIGTFHALPVARGRQGRRGLTRVAAWPWCWWTSATALPS